MLPAVSITDLGIHSLCASPGRMVLPCFASPIFTSSCGITCANDAYLDDLRSLYNMSMYDMPSTSPWPAGALAVVCLGVVLVSGRKHGDKAFTLGQIHG